MAGQGSLCQPSPHSRGHRSKRGFAPGFDRWAAGILCAILLTQDARFPSCCWAGDAATNIDARLRLEWESEEARFWNVQLRVVDTASGVDCISEVENQSESDQSTGALELSDDSRSLKFQPRHALRGGAIKIRIRASSEARLTLEVTSTAHRDDLSELQTPVKEFSLAEVIDQGTASSGQAGDGEIDGKISWTLSRIANDELRIDDLPSVPVYRPDEQLSFSVRSSSLRRYASRQLTLQYSLYRTRDGESVSLHREPIKIDPHGNSEPIAISELAPQLPGVYEIRCQIDQDDDNIWSRLRRRGPPIVRVGRPIVVLAPRESQTTTSRRNWRSVGEIRPSESSWSVGQWLPKQTTRFIPGSSGQKIDPQSTADLASQEHASESISLIPPQKTFQATLPVMETGFPHKVTIRYPADRLTKIRVDVATADSRTNPAASFVLSSDPDFDHPDSWKTYTFVHYPTNEDQIWLTNLDPSVPAAFESISVLAGPSHLMPEPGGETDRFADPRRALLRLVDAEWVKALSMDLNNAPSLAQCDPETVALHRLWTASDRLRDYARAAGMNGLVVPANSGGRSWFESTAFFPIRDRAHHWDRLATLLSLMEQSELTVFVGLQPGMLLSGVEQAIRQQPTLAAELTRNHAAASASVESDRYNPLHPMVQTSLNSLVGEIDRQCGDYSCFAGIIMQCDDHSHIGPLRDASNDPDMGTLMRFAEANASQTALSELRAWIGDRGKSAFEIWVRDETRRFYTRLAQSAASRPLVIVTQSHTGTRSGSDGFHLEPFADHWRADGAKLIPAESFCYGPDLFLGRKILLQQRLSPGGVPATQLVASPLAAHAAILGDDVRPTAGQPAVVRDRLIVDVNRVIDRIDPSILMVELPTRAGRLNDELFRSLRAFAAMPSGNTQRIEPTDPASQTVHVRTGTKDGYAYVSMISLVPWTSDVQFECFSPIDWVLVGEPESSMQNAFRQTSGTRATVVVPAEQLIVLKSKTPVTDATIKSWSSRVSGGHEALERIKRNVTLIYERTGFLSDFETYGALNNGGFEQLGGMGLVGWLHAQHPPGCVRIDDKEFVEGKHSVLLTTDPAAATRTWIVSETIDPPQSGRLAVSLACRGELANGDSVHRLRVSIEATRDREPIRFSSEIDVPRDGQWGPRDVVLEADGIDIATVESLRLTIDSLSGGRVWIDDVRLHDQFPTAKERADVKSQAFLAVRGLQLGNLTPAGRLLQNHWARHLLTLNPAPQANRVMETAKPPASAMEQTPGVADRIRSWLPRPWF